MITSVSLDVAQVQRKGRYRKINKQIRPYADLSILGQVQIASEETIFSRIYYHDEKQVERGIRYMARQNAQIQAHEQIFITIPTYRIIRAVWTGHACFVRPVSVR